MVCVESGNVAQNQTTLPPGGHAVMKVEITSEPLLS
jgi:D-hexose-6-phosphate mutarotase